MQIHPVADITNYRPVMPVNIDETTGNSQVWLTNGANDLLARVTIVNLLPNDSAASSLGEAPKLLHVEDMAVTPDSHCGSALLKWLAERASEHNVRTCYLEAVTPRIVEMVHELEVLGVVKEAHYRVVKGDTQRKFETIEAFRDGDTTAPESAYIALKRLRDNYRPGQTAQQLGGVICMFTI